MSGGYYALAKRGGKQFRRSLKTKDRHLASRRLADLRQQVSTLALSEGSRANLDQVAGQWLESVRHTMKPASIARRESCIKNLVPYFTGVAIPNVAPKDCDVWLTDRGPRVAASSFAHELGVMILAHGGCRLAEATSLRWSEADFERNLLTITRVDGHLRQEQP